MKILLMTIRAVSGLAIAVSFSLMSTAAQASPDSFAESLLQGGDSVNGLTASDLVAGNAEASSPQMSLEPQIPLSPVVRFSAENEQSISSTNVVDLMIAQSMSNQGRARTPQGDGSMRSGSSGRMSSGMETESSGPLTPDEIRQRLLIEPNSDSGEVSRGPRPVPASSFLVPSAYGADWRDGYVGFSFGTVDDDRGVDGSTNLGFGFGDAVENVGLELNIGNYSIEGFGDDGAVGFKLHKLFPSANNLAIAIGWENALKWGGADLAEDSYYGVVSQRYDLQPGRSNPMPLTASLGVGTGSYRSTGAISSGDNDLNVFASLGWQFVPQASVISSWTGNALGLAASVAPFDYPLVFTAGVSDLTDNTATGTQFVGSLGYSFRF
jgi:hypothetical protein